MYFNPLDIRRIIYPRASGLITFAKTEADFKSDYIKKALANMGRGDGGRAGAEKRADAAWKEYAKSIPKDKPAPKPKAKKPIVKKPEAKNPKARITLGKRIMSKADFLSKNRPSGDAAGDTWDAGGGQAAYNKYVKSLQKEQIKDSLKDEIPLPTTQPVQPTPAPAPQPVQPTPQPVQPTPAQPIAQPTPQPVPLPPGVQPAVMPVLPGAPQPVQPTPQPGIMPIGVPPAIPEELIEPVLDPNTPRPPNPFLNNPNRPQPYPINPAVEPAVMPMPDQMPDPVVQPTVAQPEPAVTTVDDYYAQQQATSQPAIPPKLQAFLDAQKASMQGDMDQVKKDQQVILAKYNVQPGDQPSPDVADTISKEMNALPSVQNLKQKQDQAEAQLKSMPEYETMKAEREKLVQSGQMAAAQQDQQLQTQQQQGALSPAPNTGQTINVEQSAKPVSFDEQMAQFGGPGQANTNGQAIGTGVANILGGIMGGGGGGQPTSTNSTNEAEALNQAFQAAQQKQQQQGADVGRNLNDMTTQQQQQSVTTDPVPSDREATLNTSMQKVTDIQTELNTLSNDPILSEVGDDGQPTEAAKAAQQKITQAQARLQAASVEAQNAQAQANLPRDIAKRQLTDTAITDPASLAKQSEVAKVDVQPEQFIKKGTGQAGPADLAGTTVAGPASQTAAPGQVDVTKVDPTMVTDEARKEADKVKAATGEVTKEVEAQEGAITERAEGIEFGKDRIDTIEGGTRKVTAEEQIEAAGGDEEAVKVKIAQANVPDNIKAAQATVQPEELPDAAQIAEADMAQAKAAVDEDGLDERMVAARLEKFSVDAGTLAKAAEGDVKAQDTVQGQLSSLMASFNDGTPAWAAGAMRAANNAMLSRGMGGSSMAGAAIFQAAMESALPIAMQDAQTFSRMNMANLNNRQQVALSNAAAQQGVQLQNLNNEQQARLQNSTNAFALQSQNLSNTQQTMLANAQIKASLQGQNLSNQQQANLVTAARYAEAANLNLNNRQQAVLQDNANAMTVEISNLNSKQQAYLANAQLEAALQGKQIDNQQQAAIMNAAKFSDANNLTFTAQEQAKIHNSELLKTIGLAELNSEQAATLQNAAATASMDMANLSNRQQAQVQNAQNFLAMDMANLSNEQQAVLFKAQAMQTALLSDQAADNAAKQFNAASQNQADQFMAGLTTDVAKFNTAQTNAMKQFDAGEINATAKFNAQMKNQRTEFNSKNALIVSQANAQWRQNVATLDQAAQNDSNMLLAKSQNAFTQNTVDQIWQRERDLMSMAWKSSESEQDRINNIVRQQLANDGSLDVAKLQADAQAAQGIGSGLFDIFKFAVTGSFA